MDMSTEQKCFDLGGTSKIEAHFCIKRALPSTDLMFHWEECSEYRYGIEWYVGIYCCHSDVDNNDDLDTKKMMMHTLLELEGRERVGGDGARGRVI